MNDSKWFDSRNLMAPYGENGILFTTQYCRLAENMGLGTSSLAAIAAQSQVMSKGVLRDSPTSKEAWSHDNHTALTCLSHQMGFKIHKRFFWDQWWRRAHPRDWIFYLYLKGGAARICIFPLLWICSLAMIYSCLHTWENKEKTVLRTSGKLLTWLRLQTVHMPITAFICNQIIMRNKHFGNWRKCFEIYFRDINHPNRNFPEKCYKI